MSGKECVSQKIMNDGFIISEGSWSENISWQFVTSTHLPDQNLCTAVCCITTFRNKLVLIKNKRGWEFPGGHIEPNETAEDAILREVKEEACADITDPKLFGFKKISALQRIPRRDNKSLFYPFPHSYVVFFYAEINKFLDIPPNNDVKNISIVNYSEAQNLLIENDQYTGILEHLLQGNLITLI